MPRKTASSRREQILTGEKKSQVEKERIPGVKGILKIIGNRTLLERRDRDSLGRSAETLWVKTENRAWPKGLRIAPDHKTKKGVGHGREVHVQVESVS